MDKSLEIPWVEGFVLGNKVTELEKLVPGTEDYFFYNIIHNLNQNKSVEELLQKFSESPYRHSSKLRELKFRNLLLSYEKADDKTKKQILNELQSQMNILHKHQPPLHSQLQSGVGDVKKEVNSQIDESKYNEKQFLNAKIRVKPEFLKFFYSELLLISSKSELIEYWNSGSLCDIKEAEIKFAEFWKSLSLAQQTSLRLTNIFSSFTIAQMETLVEIEPQFYDNPAYIYRYAEKFQPGTLDRKSNERKIYLLQLLGFSRKLARVNISFKFNVMHYLLQWSIDNDVHRPAEMSDLFIEYCQLPRDKYQSQFLHSSPPEVVNSVVTYNCKELSIPGLTPISQSDDITLCSFYLNEHFSLLPSSSENASPSSSSSSSSSVVLKPFNLYFSDSYLMQVCATAKIQSLNSDLDYWFAFLDPSTAKSLLEKVQLTFLEANKQYFDVNEEIALHLKVKNVQKLIVKIFEINTTNYYIHNQKEIETDISLDGLISKEELSYDLQYPPNRAVIETFTFPMINHRGVYVVEFIGNGISSRALIRKGKLIVKESVTEEGHLFKVFDESFTPLSDLSLRVDGKYYHTKDGVLTLPFFPSQRSYKVIATSQNFSVLEEFTSAVESYNLFAAITVDREELLPSANANIVIRPNIFLANQIPVPLSKLKSYSVQIKTTLNNSIAIEVEYTQSQITVLNNQLFLVSHLIPSNGRAMTVTFQCSLCPSSSSDSAKEVQLQANTSFQFNASIDGSGIASANLLPLHPLPTENDGGDNKENASAESLVVDIPTSSSQRNSTLYKLFIAGRCGEYQPSTPEPLVLNHIAFQSGLEVKGVQVDNKGFLDLGSLKNIEGVRYGSRNFQLLNSFSAIYPTSINLSSSQSLTLPFENSQFTSISLKKLKGGESSIIVIEDLSHFLSLNHHGGKSVNIKEGLAAGDYLLTLNSSTRIQIHVEEIFQDNLILGKQRILDYIPYSPLIIHQIDQIGDGGNEGGELTLRCHILNATKNTNVYIVFNRFLPPYYAGVQLTNVYPLSPSLMTTSSQQSQYVSGRELGDENRYIFDRKYLSHYMGSSLPLPTLQVNRYQTKIVTNSQGFAKAGDLYAAKGIGSKQSTSKFQIKSGLTTTSLADDRCLDFLRYSSYVQVVPVDENGIAQLTLHHPHHFGSFVQIVAMNELHTVMTNYIVRSRRASIPLRQVVLTDSSALNPNKHYVEKSQVSVIYPPSEFRSRSSSNFNAEIFDTLSKVSLLYSRISSEKELFNAMKKEILEWPKYDEDEKKRKYREVASNEFHFFAYRKDREFFNSVIIPHLKEKPFKTFWDKLFLGYDLSEYLLSWNYQSLNTFEKILLCWRTGNLEKIIKSLSSSFPLQKTKSEIELFEHALHICGSDFNPNMIGGGGGEGGGGGGQFYARSRRAEPDAYYSDAPRMAKKSMMSSMSRPSSTHKRRTSCELMTSLDAAPSYDDDVCNEKESESEEDVRMDYNLPTTTNEEKRRQPSSSASSKIPTMSTLDFIRKRITENTTKEYVEQSYYRQLPQRSYSSRIQPSRFWLEYAQYLLTCASIDGDDNNNNNDNNNINNNNNKREKFLPKSIELAGKNNSELILALSVIDLPFFHSNAEVEFHVTGGISTVKSDTPFIVYHKDIIEETEIESSPVMLYECFFDNSNRYQTVNGENFELFCSGSNHEYLVNQIYGAKVIITNATDMTQHFEVLCQIPVGAVPLLGSQTTNNYKISLSAYRSDSIVYYFYFPYAGIFPHFPSHLAKNGIVQNCAKPTLFTVTTSPSNISQSWSSLALFGSDQIVLKEFREMEEIVAGKINDIAYRLKSEEFYREMISILSERFTYNEVVWSYSFYHKDQPRIIEFMQNHSSVPSLLNFSFIQSLLYSFNPIDKSYFHREYDPVSENRIHKFGAERKLLNDGVRSQYLELLSVLSYKPSLSHLDRLELIYYLLLMNRLDDAISQFNQIESTINDNNDNNSLNEQLVYNYYKSYLLFAQNELEEAKKVAERYSKCAIDHFRDRFTQIISQIHALQSKTFSLSPHQNNNDDDQKDVAKAKIQFKAVSKKRKLHILYDYNDTPHVTLNYYPIDIELLFSNSPFFSASTTATQFSYIRPNFSEQRELEAEKNEMELEINKEYQQMNVMVEVDTGVTQQYFPLYFHSMKVRLVPERGLLQVVHKSSGAPINKVYVKIYGSSDGKSGTFYKDGYTDIHGIFDMFTSSNMEKLLNFQSLAILLSSENPSGTVVKILKLR